MSFNVSSWAWKQEVSGNTKYVLLALADYANADGMCFPSQKTLARKCGLSRATVNAQIKNLKAVGLLTVQNQHTEKGYKIASLYRLHLGES